MVAMTGDLGVATTQKAGDAEGMPVLDFSPGDFTSPLEQKLEEKFPLKTKGKYVLQMDNPYLLLNRGAFEAAGMSEEEAENTTKSMVEQIFSTFVSRTGDATADQADARGLASADTIWPPYRPQLLPLCGLGAPSELRSVPVSMAWFRNDALFCKQL